MGGFAVAAVALSALLLPTQEQAESLPREKFGRTLGEALERSLPAGAEEIAWRGGRAYRLESESGDGYLASVTPDGRLAAIYWEHSTLGDPGVAAEARTQADAAYGGFRKSRAVKSNGGYRLTFADRTTTLIVEYLPEFQIVSVLLEDVELSASLARDRARSLLP